MAVIAFANTKGGVGKSTLAAHFAASFEHASRPVSLIDLDFQQRSLTHFMAARRRLEVAAEPHLDLIDLKPDRELAQDARRAAFVEQFQHTIAELRRAGHLAIIDLPATGGGFFGVILQAADIVFTPVNESMVDLAVIEAQDGAAGPLGRAVRNARRQREQNGDPPLQWAIVLNRLSPLASRNSERVRERLNQLSSRWRFAVAGGLTERVAYRSLFDEGRTLIDSAAASQAPSESTLRALDELSQCLGSLGVHVSDGRRALDDLHAAGRSQGGA